MKPGALLGASGDCPNSLLGRAWCRDPAAPGSPHRADGVRPVPSCPVQSHAALEEQAAPTLPPRRAFPAQRRIQLLEEKRGRTSPCSGQSGVLKEETLRSEKGPCPAAEGLAEPLASPDRCLPSAAPHPWAQRPPNSTLGSVCPSTRDGGAGTLEKRRGGPREPEQKGPRRKRAKPP